MLYLASLAHNAWRGLCFCCPLYRLAMHAEDAVDAVSVECYIYVHVAMQAGLWYWYIVPTVKIGLKHHYSLPPLPPA